jgi:threonine/homoserine/homoserine lactone efflux protein
MLVMAPGGRGKGTALVAGWLAGMVVVLTVFAVTGPLVSGEPRTAVSVLQVVLGILLLALAVRAWRRRPHDGEVPEPPPWMTKVQSATTAACVGTGALLSGLNPKNLSLTAAAGGEIGAADLSTGGAVAAGAVFVVLASAGMLAVVGSTLLAPDRSATALERLRTWLVSNNSTVMLVLLLVLGAKVLGDGLRGLA